MKEILPSFAKTGLSGVVRYFLLIWIYLIIYPVNIEAQIKHYQHFNVSDGLLTNQLTNLVEGPDGAIWITTNGAGICRFDGQSFRHYNDLDSVGTSYYFAACVDRKELWFGGENFLLRRMGSTNKLYAIPEVGAIRQIVPFNDSLLFCVAEDTAFIMAGNSGKIWTISLPDGQINQVVKHQEYIWATTMGGVWQFVSNRWYRRYPAQGSGNNCTALLSSGSDGLLVVDTQKGLVKVDSGQQTIVVPLTALPANDITFLKEGDLGEIYFGTANVGIQIFQWLDSLWLTIDEKQLQFNHVTAMIFDQWENAWVTTDGGGLTRFYSEAYTIYPATSLSGNYIRKLEKWGDTLAIYYQGGNWDILIGQMSLPEQIDLLPGHVIAAKCLTKSGCWYAEHQKLIFARDSSIETVDLSGLEGSPLINDLEDVDSVTVLVATNQSIQLVSINRIDTLHAFTQQNIHNQPAKDLVRDKYGKIWFYNDHEVGIYTDSAFVVRPVSGKPLCLISFDENTMLLGTRNTGLFLVDFTGGAIQMQTISSPLRELRNIRALAQDQYHHLWIGLQNEILECQFARSRPLEIIKTYGQTSGLPRFEVYENSMQSDPGHGIYAGTSDGLLRIVSESNFQTVKGPVLSLLNISTSKERLDLLNDHTLDQLQYIRPNDAGLDLHFEAIDQRTPKSISYLYRLSPNILEWTTSRSGGDFQFYGLPSGHYTFAIKAVNQNGRSSEIIEIPFTVLMPFYRQWWFVILILLLPGGFLYSFYRWRLNIQLGKNQQIAEKLETQNQVLRLEQAARRLQMNPHFIFNALQSIQIKIAEGDRDVARADLQIFSKLMRSYLDHARAEKITLEDEIALLNQYLQVEQSLKGGRFAFDITVPDDIDPSFIEIPAMLLQPFVENAVKHGLPGDGSMGQIRVTFNWFGKHLSCTITDNGTGISLTKDESAHQSAGMDITRQRLNAFFGKTRLNPLVVVNQSAKTGSTQRGTKVRVLLPMEF